MGAPRPQAGVLKDTVVVELLWNCAIWLPGDITEHAVGEVVDTGSLDAAHVRSILDVALPTPVGVPGSVGGVVSGASTVIGSEVSLITLVLLERVQGIHLIRVGGPAPNPASW